MYPQQYPLYPQQFQQFQQPQQNILPPQQILQANGKSSIDSIRMSPNSSVLIADSTAPIVWKCVSDSIGNVTAEPFDITPHKDERQKEQENMSTIIASIDERLRKLEVEYEQSITKRNETEYSKSKPNKTNMGNAQKYGKPSSYVEPNDAE